MAIRGTDIIAVVRQRSAHCSLVDAKASAADQPFSPSPSSSLKAASSANYKVLVPAQGEGIDFDIRHLSVNPTGKLLACVGDSRSLSSSCHGQDTPSMWTDKSSAVPFRSSILSLCALGCHCSKADWHPWAKAAPRFCSHRRCLLREYDVAKDTEEPQQTASFLPLNSTTYSYRSGLAQQHLASALLAVQAARGFGLTADDDDATTAVSFSLCVSDTPVPRSTP